MACTHDVTGGEIMVTLCQCDSPTHLTQPSSKAMEIGPIKKGNKLWQANSYSLRRSFVLC